MAPTLSQRECLTILLAEQNATLALRYADRGYVRENGRVAASGPARELAARPDIQHFYLGVGAAGRQRLGTLRSGGETRAW